LTIADFKVRDRAGACEVRDVTLLRDTPLAVGILVDTSESLLLHRGAPAGDGRPLPREDAEGEGPGLPDALRSGRLEGRRLDPF